jgi:hypothetical protein
MKYVNLNCVSDDASAGVPIQVLDRDGNPLVLADGQLLFVTSLVANAVPPIQVTSGKMIVASLPPGLSNPAFAGMGFNLGTNPALQLIAAAPGRVVLTGTATVI